MGKKQQKSKAIALTFRPFFINGQKTAKKVRLYIALTFRPFLGSVHYLYPGLVPKRNRLGKPFFWGMKGWVNIF